MWHGGREANLMTLGTIVETAMIVINAVVAIRRHCTER